LFLLRSPAELGVGLRLVVGLGVEDGFAWFSVVVDHEIDRLRRFLTFPEAEIRDEAREDPGLEIRSEVAERLVRVIRLPFRKLRGRNPRLELADGDPEGQGEKEPKSPLRAAF
jgi:hypothetical protein